MCWWSGNKNIPDASADPHALLPHPGGDGADRGVLIAAYNVPRTLVAGRKRGSVTRAKCRCSPCCWLQLQSDSFLTLFPCTHQRASLSASFLSNFSTKFHSFRTSVHPYSQIFELQYTHVRDFYSNFRTSVHTFPQQPRRGGGL